MHPKGARRNKDDHAIISNAGPYHRKPAETNKPKEIPKANKLKNVDVTNVKVKKVKKNVKMKQVWTNKQTWKRKKGKGKKKRKSKQYRTSN